VAVGSGAAWVSCYQTVCRHQQAGEWLVLEGEPGSGRETVVRAAHAAGNPAGLLRVVRADTYGPSWLTELAEEMAAGACTVLITDVDQLTDDVMPGVVEVLERYRESTESDRPWVVATTRPAQLDSRPALAELIACFPRTVDVPPLRRHIEDLDELVPHLLARAKRDATPVCSPEVMRVLKHNRWPGNVDQLQSVLRRIITKRRAGTIELTDLPAECWTAGKRVLSPLESLECDAIVSALLATNGNKVEAARRLSMSRATIYRKVRDYAIVLPSVAELGLGG
jgi:transcriptional regulator of acetoin/glycerol metabolism